MPADSLIRSALIRSDQALHTQLGPPDAIPCGTAYAFPQYPGLPDANQVRDFLLIDQSCADAFALVEDYFSARATRCLRWALSPDQSPEPVAAHLASLGWQPTERAVFGQQQIDLTQIPAAAKAPSDLRILPARAMRRAYHATFAESGEPSAGTLAASDERLNDSNYDAFVAVANTQPLGRIALFQPGDICRIHDLQVSPTHRGRGIGRALLRHVLQLAYRLRPRVVVADAHGSARERELAAAWLARFGFESAGTLIEWNRPTL